MLWINLGRAYANRGCRHKLRSRDNAIARLAFIIIDYRCPIVIIRSTRACDVTVSLSAARAFLFFSLVSFLIARPEESGDPRDDVLFITSTSRHAILPIIAGAARRVHYVRVINARARPRASRSEETIRASNTLSERVIARIVVRCVPKPCQTMRRADFAASIRDPR